MGAHLWMKTISGRCMQGPYVLMEGKVLPETPHSTARRFQGQGPPATWRAEHWGPAHSPTSAEESPTRMALRGAGRKCGQGWEGNC